MTKTKLCNLLTIARSLLIEVDQKLCEAPAINTNDILLDSVEEAKAALSALIDDMQTIIDEENDDMSTADVPGANPANGDALAMGCWAEHDDGSLIFVEGCEGGTVVYSVFDMSGDKPLEYRDSMTELAFKQRYTQDHWTWHDKTGFPWQRIFDDFSPGVRYAAADDHLTAAQRIAQHRNLGHGREPDKDDKGHWLETIAAQATRHIMTGVSKAIRDLRP